MSWALATSPQHESIVVESSDDNQSVYEVYLTDSPEESDSVVDSDLEVTETELPLTRTTKVTEEQCCEGCQR